VKTRLTNKDRIIDSLEATLRDLEIRACWVGLKATDMNYTQKLEYVMAFWSVSKETAEKALYSDKTISQ